MSTITIRVPGEAIFKYCIFGGFVGLGSWIGAHVTERSSDCIGGSIMGGALGGLYGLICIDRPMTAAAISGFFGIVLGVGGYVQGVRSRECKTCDKN